MSTLTQTEKSPIFTEKLGDGQILFRDSGRSFAIIESAIVLSLGHGDERLGQDTIIAIIERLQLADKTLTSEKIRAWVHGVTIEKYGDDHWIVKDPENSIGNPLSADFLIRVGEGDLELGKERVKAYAQNKIFHDLKEPKVVINNELTEANILGWVRGHNQGATGAYYEGDFT